MKIIPSFVLVIFLSLVVSLAATEINVVTSEFAPFHHVENGQPNELTCGLKTNCLPITSIKKWDTIRMIF